MRGASGAADAFGRLTRGQRETGAFLLAEPSDNPETLWFHELATLHAAASYAVQAEDRTVAAAVAKATAAQYPAVADLFQIDYFGGWKEATPKYFGDGGIFSKAIAEVQQ